MSEIPLSLHPLYKQQQRMRDFTLISCGWRGLRTAKGVWEITWIIFSGWPCPAPCPLPSFFFSLLPPCLSLIHSIIHSIKAFLNSILLNSRTLWPPGLVNPLVRCFSLMRALRGLYCLIHLVLITGSNIDLNNSTHIELSITDRISRSNRSTFVYLVGKKNKQLGAVKHPSTHINNSV